MNVLISGAGIAGPTLAYWLLEYGFKVTIVEKAHDLRTDGYMIDFWGAGFDIAERMGLLPEVQTIGYKIKRLNVVNRRGKRISGFPVNTFGRITHDRFISLPRGELAAAIYKRIEGRVESLFRNSVDHLEQTPTGVQVTFESGHTREFDFVIGADGLHSRIRELAFGPITQFEKYLGVKVAAFHVDGYQPRDELAYFMYSEVGQQVGRFSMRGNRTMFLFTFADPDPKLPADRAGMETLLKRRFGDSGWECPQILSAMPHADSLYFDRVSQIHMNESDSSWTRGRITLVGDAAFCVSLLAGQGSALSMVAAYVLAGELHRAGGDYAAAFARYQQLFGPFVARKQKAALRFAGTFAPKSSFSLWLRNRVMALFSLPWMADVVVGRELADRITLPAY